MTTEPTVYTISRVVRQQYPVVNLTPYDTSPFKVFCFVLVDAQ